MRNTWKEYIMNFDESMFLVKRTYKSWLNSELALENTSFRTSEPLKLMDSMSSVSRDAVISSWSKARRSEPTEKPSDVDEDGDELVEFELLNSKSLMNSKLKYQMTKMSQFHRQK